MLYQLGQDNNFPPVSKANGEGLLAIGGDLNPKRLLHAYRLGIFPWYNRKSPILWWCPNPRFVLFPTHLRVSHSMRQVLVSDKFQYRFNTSFSGVIKACSEVKRKGQKGTWILPEMIAAYEEMHRLGFAVSAETWKDNSLVGGLYGMRMGRIFFGESMFSLESNASKFAFIHLVGQLREEGISLIDCQTYSAHLESLGAQMVSRKLFSEILDREIGSYSLPI
ncbi:MAG: leucyl/phenylalanyl-tRNA--protein transferase [Chitinophagaceae bacterium]|nr:leucyl/phenylalanyl-tRNA--protein transferase [Chitinophagaceae bacterium]